MFKVIGNRSLLAAWILTSCAREPVVSQDSLRGKDGNLAAQIDEAKVEINGLNLTQDECKAIAPELSKRITISPRGELYINAPEVINNTRADNQTGGKWSFAYAMRELLELPQKPASDPSKLAAEEVKVDEFISMFSAQRNVNGFTPQNRTRTVDKLVRLWGTTTDSTGKARRTFAKAPFRLKAIVNRLDIVKKGLQNTAGEGRLIFGLEDAVGVEPMTVILEYTLVTGSASPTGMTTPEWANRWHALKSFLKDEDSSLPGTQPDQNPMVQPAFKDLPGYLTALEAITERFVNRDAKFRLQGDLRGIRVASISQIRTNEFLSGSQWSLREIIRRRDANNLPFLQLETVKNNPNKAAWFRSGILANYILKNTKCEPAQFDRFGRALRGGCEFTTADGLLPEVVTDDTGKSKPLLAGESLVDFGRWFPNQPNAACQARDADCGRKFEHFETQTCAGCHAQETSTPFTHANPMNGNPSTFVLEEEIPRRMDNLRNLICLAAQDEASMNLAGSPADFPIERRHGYSTATH